MRRFKIVKKIFAALLSCARAKTQGLLEGIFVYVLASTEDL